MELLHRRVIGTALTKWQHLIDKLEGAYADKTIAGYRADFADFAAWARRKRLAALPAVAATLARYVDEIGERLKPSSVRRKLSATQREDAVEEGLALFVTWNPKRLAKLIVVLRHISSRELADRLESRIPPEVDDVASNLEEREGER